VQGFELAARCQPARETGGDFYDFIEFGDGCLGLVIADVAGKGMPAALLMADSRSTWRAEARNEHRPAEVLRRVNRTLCHDVHSGFVTLLYAMLNPATRQLRLASAAHPLPLLHNDSGLQEVQVYGLPLGLSPDAVYDEVELTLAPGDTLFMYTDGVVETLNRSREFFGFERLMDLMRREGHRPAENLIGHTLGAVYSFGGPVNQADDITIMALKAQP
jgi:serine phosphatase RsbU (regulator of sigma subunit)